MRALAIWKASRWSLPIGQRPVKHRHVQDPGSQAAGRTRIPLAGPPAITPGRCGLKRRVVAKGRAHPDIPSGAFGRTIQVYKLVTLMTLLQIGQLRSGADVAEMAWTAHQIVIADPRLLADARSAKERPDPASMTADAWREFWLEWSLRARTGQLRGNASAGLFRIVGHRFLPAFAVADELGETFDAMIQELVDYRLARYLFGQKSQPAKEDQLEAAYRLKITQARGRPILRLYRDRNPALPEGETQFVANDVVYTGNFASIALNAARFPGEPGNPLPDLLRSWFGAGAGQPEVQDRLFGLSSHQVLGNSATGLPAA